MKRKSKLFHKLILTMLLGGLVATPGFTLADTTAENTTYIQSLKPDWKQLLSVSLAPTAQPVVKDGRVSDNSKVVICTSEDVTAGLEKWISENAILNPGSTSIWPGALLVGDRNLAQGTPTPLILPRRPITIRVNLPGLNADDGTRTIEDPTNVKVNNAISDVVVGWLNNSSNDFVPSLRAFSQSQKSYSLSQAAVDLGFGAQWTNGNFSSSMKTQSSSETTVTLKSFKQIYYSVDIEESGTAGSFFANSYKLSENDISNTKPPVYVRSVDYGRLLIAQMQVDKAISEFKAQAAMEYASVKSNVDSDIKSIAESAQYRIIAIGGGAQPGESVELFSGDFSKFREAINNGFVFSKNNPAEPLSYIVASLDRELRLMNMTTTYVKSECQEYPNRSVELRSTGGFVSMFKVKWTEPDGRKSWKSGEKSSPYRSGRIYIPGDSTHIEIIGENYTGLVWDPKRKPLHLMGSDLTDQHSCYELKGTTLSSFYDQCS